nr:unnamed protein product [Callosobruchus analis]
MDGFKDRNAARDAWRELCYPLKEGFEEMQSKEKNEFGKYGWISSTSRTLR